MLRRTASAVPWYQWAPVGVCCAASTSTNERENWSNLYAEEMCRMSEVLLNCVSTYICRNPELMQFEIGISTMRYLPASGTAGFDRSLVRGKSRVPAPPPMMMARVRCSMERILPEVMAME